MKDARLSKYEDAKRARENAEEWNSLPYGPKYLHCNKFNISLAHCTKPVLVRGGQQYAGGKNYWNSGEEMNLTILEYIVDNWEEIEPKVMNRMKNKERIALMECQSFIDEMQAKISCD